MSPLPFLWLLHVPLKAPEGLARRSGISTGNPLQRLRGCTGKGGPFLKYQRLKWRAERGVRC